MKVGDRVTVVAYGGKRLARRVVADRGRAVVICNEIEYSQAQVEGRKPDGIAFPRECVLVETINSGATKG